jgi:Sec-independent protein secretion pathway component TatC
MYNALFFLELKYKHITALFLFLFTWVSIIYNINLIIFLLAKNLLNIIPTQKFIYTNINEIYWVYFQISILCTFLIIIPFLWINYLQFFITGLFYKEFFFISKIIGIFFFYYYGSILLSYYFIFPNILKISFIFENSNEYFPLYFEARFEDYFLNACFILLILIFLFQIPFFLCLYLHFKKPSIKKLLKIKKLIYIMFLFFEFLAFPFDLGFFILWFFSFLFFFELILVNFLIFKFNPNF